MTPAILYLEGHSWNIQLSPRIPGFESTVHPMIYVCPHCCNIWARIKIPSRWFYIQHIMPCETCGKPFERMRQPIPGSLIPEYSMLPWDTDSGFHILAALPPVLIEREFSLHLRYSGNL